MQRQAPYTPCVIRASFSSNIIMNIKFLAGYFRFLWQQTFEPDPLRKKKKIILW